MKEKNKWHVVAYVLLIIVLSLLMFLHLFNIVTLSTDKFAFFLVSLLFVVLILPSVRHIKFFDLVDVIKKKK